MYEIIRSGAAQFATVRSGLLKPGPFPGSVLDLGTKSLGMRVPRDFNEIFCQESGNHGTQMFCFTGSGNHETARLFLYGIRPTRFSPGRHAATTGHYGIRPNEMRPRRNSTGFLYGMQPRRDLTRFLTRATSWRLVPCQPALLQQPSRQVWPQEDNQVLQALYPRIFYPRTSRPQEALLPRWKQAPLFRPR